MHPDIAYPWTLWLLVTTNLSALIWTIRLLTRAKKDIQAQQLSIKGLVKTQSELHQEIQVLKTLLLETKIITKSDLINKHLQRLKQIPLTLPNRPETQGLRSILKLPELFRLGKGNDNDTFH
ncbi:MAG: hypothetical protein VYA34_01110 [Myxococcota bacterium]|nr:hypothetical protein [Myxococcota bacterium]